MKTYAELKSFCEKNNVKFEVNPIEKKYYDYFGEEKTYIAGYYFGMNNIAGRKGLSEWNWVWFECYESSLNDDSNFFFYERYSMVNGKSYKGRNELWNVERTIERRA